MKQIYLGLVIHNHQPLDNFPWVFEQAYLQAYLPMLEALERHPIVRISLHYSGCLIDWLKQNHPEFLYRLAKLVERKQIEMIGGAYYEPILPAIPDVDKLGQIAKMNATINREFGSKPTGLWLAERVWEPYLANALAMAGIEWTLVDDAAFKLVGLETKDLFGYYITEDQGYPVKVFPINKHLRYSIPWYAVDKIINYLSDEASDKKCGVAVLGDDGEKFGIWPGTYDYCWQKQWVDKFFTALESNQDWLRTISLGEYARQFPPLGRIYLPCSTYDEMLEWSLPSSKSREYTNLKRQLEARGRSDITQFMYSGLWHNFLIKYPEVNLMHKKMLHVHRKVYEAQALSGDDCGLEELWKAQCSCPYWHGVFGGIYLADIRAATYTHLIRAENKADRIIHEHRSRLGKACKPKRTWLEWQKIDFDRDGFDEVLVESSASSVYLRPEEGGAIFEWDIRYHNYNLFNTLARRPEAYHQVLTDAASKKQTEETDAISSIHDLVRIKDEKASRFLFYDEYPRFSLIDHFLSPGTRLKEFANNSYRELGNFVGQPYELSVEEERGEIIILCLRRSGMLQTRRKSLPFEIQKRIKLEAEKERLEINYILKNISDLPIEALFGNEWNINLLGGGHNKQAYYEIPGLTLDNCRLDSRGELVDIEKVALGNRHLDIELELTATPHIRLWYFPVETISNSEGGIERLYQASCLLALLPFTLLPGEITSFDLVWQVKPISN